MYSKNVSVIKNEKLAILLSKFPISDEITLALLDKRDV